MVARFNTMGRTIVLITHDMRLIAEYATRAIVLRRGEIVLDDTPRALFQRPDILSEAHLALPPVTRLSNRLGEVGMATCMLTSAEFASAWQSRLDERAKARKRKAREKQKKAQRATEKG